MKNISNDYKNEIYKFGRQIDSKITYELDGETIELGKSQLNSITPHYEGGILKSVMKQLDIDSSVDIPLGTILTYEFGVFINNQYEYINLGNYVVYSSEKQEDLNSYKIVCYDKILYSMKDYENLNITYPITIRNYINTVCTHLGLTFANASDTFPNYDKEITKELYLDEDGNSLNYTFRDVLDELAQVTASTICINEDNDELEIRYINDTEDTIDEHYLKDINVNFGEKYGPVNSIVLSRAGESDNVYLRDEESVTQNGLCEIKIKENQIMNFNDRSDYLPDILQQLDGLEYYLNDFTSTGITYYEICDKYNISIDNNIYPCIMFNDNINITQGLEENVYTDMPEDSETNYKKADKTDRKINQTYIIVDKQNQKITSLTNEVNEFDERITTVEQTVDGIEQTVEVIEDLKRKTSGTSIVHFTEAVPDRPLRLSIKNVEMLYPSETLYPSQTLYPIGSYLVVDNQQTLSENAKMYKLPLKTLYRINDVYDEFVLERNNAYIIHRIGLKPDNTTYILQNEVIEDLGTFEMTFLDGENYVYLYSFKENPVIYEVEYLVHSEFTDTFTTETYVDSSINQTANEIMLQVNEKVDEGEIIAKLNVAVENDQGVINLTGNTVTIDSDKFKLDADGKIQATAGDIGGFNLTTDNFNKNIEGLYDFNYADLSLIKGIVSSKLTENNLSLELYDLNNDGQIKAADYSKAKLILRGLIENDKIAKARFEINSDNPKNCVQVIDEYNNIAVSLGIGGINASMLMTEGAVITDPDDYNSSGLTNGIYLDKSGDIYATGTITCDSLVQTSLEEKKKNIEKYDNKALDIIKKIDIYKYNLEKEKDKSKKHIGFIIGKDYNYSEEITSINNDGVDNYSFTSLLCKAIQEQQEEIEKLKKEIKKLKEEK